MNEKRQISVSKVGKGEWFWMVHARAADGKRPFPSPSLGLGRGPGWWFTPGHGEDPTKAGAWAAAKAWEREHRDVSFVWSYDSERGWDPVEPVAEPVARWRRWLRFPRGRSRRALRVHARVRLRPARATNR